MAHIWVRAEQRNFEQRVGITPTEAQEFKRLKHRITVEESQSRIFPLADYIACGCETASEGSWPQAPPEAIIFGLKELDQRGPDLKHRHIMFGHAFKGQKGAETFLRRFKRGGGTLYDLEYLTDESGRRLAAFGYWAGFAGAAVGVKVWLEQQMGQKIQTLSPYSDQVVLIDELVKELATVKKKNGGNLPSVIILGALGRSGRGAADLIDALNLPVTHWDRAETASEGAFDEIFRHEIFINCVFATESTPVFIPVSRLSYLDKLSVVADVSCDPGSNFNPVPIYEHSTNFSDPIIRVLKHPSVLDVMAIDNLPSLLPTESSSDFARQLLPHLLKLDHLDKNPWKRASNIFQQHLENF